MSCLQKSTEQEFEVLRSEMLRVKYVIPTYYWSKILKPRQNCCIGKLQINIVNLTKFKIKIINKYLI